MCVCVCVCVCLCGEGGGAQRQGVQGRKSRGGGVMQAGHLSCNPCDADMNHSLLTWVFSFLRAMFDICTKVRWWGRGRGGAEAQEGLHKSGARIAAKSVFTFSFFSDRQLWRSDLKSV